MDVATHPPIPTRPATPEDAAFERWLELRLGRLYDPVLREAVPPELLRLLEG